MNTNEAIASPHLRLKQQQPESSHLSSLRQDSWSSIRTCSSTATLEKTVTFASNSRCLVVQSHRDMSDAERDATWRTKADIMANDNEIIEMVRAARRGYLPTSFDDTHCIRGLEKVISQSASRNANRSHSRRIEAVLNAQDEAWQQGLFLADEHLLKNISETISDEDIEKAITQAASDEAYCRGIRRLEAKAA